MENDFFNLFSTVMVESVDRLELVDMGYALLGGALGGLLFYKFFSFIDSYCARILLTTSGAVLGGVVGGAVGVGVGLFCINRGDSIDNQNCNLLMFRS